MFCFTSFPVCNYRCFTFDNRGRCYAHTIFTLPNHTLHYEEVPLAWKLKTFPSVKMKKKCQRAVGIINLLLTAACSYQLFKLWNYHSRFCVSEMYNFLNGGNWHLCPPPCPSSSSQSKQCDYFFFFKPKYIIPDFVRLKWILFWMEAIGTIAQCAFWVVCFPSNRTSRDIS